MRRPKKGRGRPARKSFSPRSRVEKSRNFQRIAAPAGETPAPLCLRLTISLIIIPPMSSWRHLLATLMALALAVWTHPAAEPEADPKDLPRIPPTEPERVLSTFRIKPGFHLELVAAEPRVMDPIALAFDENGRLFVVEMCDYSERRQEKLGRIRLLEDTDGDGCFDKDSVFADELPWPTAVICYKGGIFVAATPDIFYFKDQNGDGVADEKKIVFTGFAKGVERLNVQALPNSFTWGLDNRIHGATGPNGGSITSVNAPSAKLLELRGRDFSFDPRTLTMRAESGGAQHGLSFDSRGRKFVCSNSSHIQTLMYEDRYAARNPFYAMPKALVEIAVDGGAAPVYRTSPDEPWRVIRTQWRVAGKVSGPIEGGGKPSGYFTAATGVTIYRGNAFPEEFQGDAFIADCGSNLVHRKKVRTHGIELKAERPVDEQNAEFLTSTDNWFRPVQFANAPDGTLYIADMYREVIEHPWSLPESIKKHLDLNSGNDRGRIYRIVPEGFSQPKPPRLGKASVAELVATLENSNGWHRDTAARLLFERQDPLAVPALERLLERSKFPVAKLHALHALHSQSALAERHLLKALADGDEAVRVQALRLSEQFLHLAERRKRLEEKILGLTNDVSALVRYQLAFTLGEGWYSPDKIKALARIARRDVDNPWLQAAVSSSLKRGAGEMFAILSADAPFRSGKAAQDFLRQLVDLIGANHQAQEIDRVFDFLSRLEDQMLMLSLAGALGEGLQRTGSSLATTGQKWHSLFQQARCVAGDQQQSDALRIQAVHLLGLARYADVGTNLFLLLEPRQPQGVQAAAMASLARFSGLQVAADLLKRWPSLSPQLRREAVAVMMRRPERIAALLTAVEKGQLALSDLNAVQIDSLRRHRDSGLRQRAIKVLGAAKATPRQDLINTFLPALKLSGNATAGQAIYLDRCASCHRLGEQGLALGPDLATVKSSGKEKVLVNILDPNREVAPNYLSYAIDTREGESLNGIIGNETAASVTLRQASGGDAIVPRANIVRMESTGKSLMPEGLEAGLSAQEMADLLEFIIPLTAESK